MGHVSDLDILVIGFLGSAMFSSAALLCSNFGDKIGAWILLGLAALCVFTSATIVWVRMWKRRK